MVRHSFFIAVSAVWLTVTLVGPVCCYGQVLTDKAGFVWDFSASGSVDDGTQDAFDGAFLLYVDGNSFDGTAMGVEENGVLKFGPVQVGSVMVTRYVRLIDDPPGIVYADNFENKTGGKVSVNPMLMSDYGDSATPQSLLSSDGLMVAMSYNHAPARPTIVHIFGDKNTEYLPSMTGSSDTYNFQFPPLEIEAGQSQAIGYFLAQRSPGGGAAIFGNSEALANGLSLISSAGDFNFANSPALGIYQTGDFRIVAQGVTDFLETHKKDQVYGRLITKEFQLQTELGTRKYKSDEIVTMASSEEGNFKIAALDGSLLEGRLAPEKIEFELSDGLAGEINTNEVSVLVPRREIDTTLDAKASKKLEKDRRSGKWFQFTVPVFVFTSNDRLTGKLKKDSFKVHTELGELDVPAKMLQSIELSTGGSSKQPRFKTLDGQAFSGLIYEDFEVEIFDGTTQKISPKNLSGVFFSQPTRKSTRIPVDKAFIKLGNRDILLASVLSDQQPLEFETAFGTREINPEQIRKLRTIAGLKSRIEITLWDGSHLKGTLTSKTVLMNLLGRSVEIASDNIKEFENPMAMPPKEIKDEYIKLIHQLGSKKYKERSAAVRKLENEKSKIRGLLKSQLDQVDVETKARIWKLLPENERPKTKGETKPAAG